MKLKLLITVIFIHQILFAASIDLNYLNPYLEQCSNQNAHPNTMKAIIKTESGGNPFALNLNGKRNGKRIKLAKQPKNMEQAKAWATYLEQNNYNFDVGVAQVNIRNIHKYGYTAAEALDLCVNVKMASMILKKNYHQALYKSSNQQDAVKMAISAYNTGNYRNGFFNGYVSKVLTNSKKVQVAQLQQPVLTSY